MLVVPWTTLFPSLLALIVLLSWWLSDPKSLHLNLIATLGCLVSACTLAPDLTRQVFTNLRSYFAASGSSAFRFENVVFNNASMIVTGAALVWLLRRAAQTLWKPVPELIGILGVEVPAPPDVSLTAIGADKATVSWTRPPPNRPVHKFVIQVNGVNVGESATNQDTFITVSGLKPNHFYNVRIIAVASNNFQAGSRVLRLRTFGEDGRPRLGSSRLPPGFSRTDTQRSTETEDSTRHVVATFASAPPPDSIPSPSRETNPLGITGPQGRRNTVGRRHSPSTTSLDQVSIKGPNDPSEAEMAELNQKYLSLRRDTEETAQLIEKEDEDAKKQVDELEAEKAEKRKEQKKKEEQTEKLRREQGTTDRSMRTAIQRKTQKEKQLKEKTADLCRLRETVARWNKGIEEMKKEQEIYDKQKSELEEEQESKGSAFRQAIEALQQECTQLETELKEKRQEVKELEDARQNLPGGEAVEDSEWPRERMEMKRDWQRRELAYRNQLLEENRRAANLDNHIHTLTAQLQQIPSAAYGMYDQANASGYDLDAPHGQIKRRSRTGTSLSNVAIPSPSQGYLEPSMPPGFSASRPGAPSFAIGPFMGFSADQPDSDEAGVRALMAGAPLSPSATSLLPSNIFADDEPSSPEFLLRSSPFVPAAQTGSPDDVPQSPASSARSLSILSSPQGSSHNLPFSQYTGENSERRSLKGLSSPLGPPNQSPAANTNKLSGFFSFQRSRDAKPLDEGPALGSLKTGQSQSFPRQTEDDLKLGGRRINLSSWNVFNRNSVGPEIMEGHVVPPAKGFSARNLLPFASRGVANRDPSSPRPASIASSEMPRPSTDSGSIWGPPPDAMTKASRIWSMENPWSRNPSRRPSIHGSPSMLETNLASAEDEILDEEAIRASPSQVGVIGSRPPAAKKSLAKSLNPAAPTFMTNLFTKTAKSEKDGSIKDKPKGKDKAKDKKDKAGKTATPETPLGPSPSFTMSVEESPSDYSRQSRDDFSVHTQTSVSESRDSLSLDQSISNTPSEPQQASTPKDAENAFKKLFRKDSTSKLSLTQRIRSRGKTGATNSNSSDKTPSGEHRSSFGDFEEHGDETSSFGRSFDGSVASSGGSPSLGPSKSRESKLGRATSGSWFSRKSKVNKEKESLDMDRDEWEDGNKV